jgi:hypothetical protein
MMYFTMSGASVSKLPNSVQQTPRIETAVPPSGHAEKIQTRQPPRMMTKAPSAVRAAVSGSRWKT